MKKKKKSNSKFLIKLKAVSSLQIELMQILRALFELETFSGHTACFVKSFYSFILPYILLNYRLHKRAEHLCQQ